MEFIYLIFYAALRLRFLDMETNHGPRRPVFAVCRILCSNVWGPAGNLSDLTVASSRYDILFCSETLVSDMRHMSELLVPGFGRRVLLCRGKMPWAHGMVAYVLDGYEGFRLPEFECGCCEMLVFRVCGVRQNLYVYSLYRIPGLDDRIFDHLQASSAAVQAEDVRASFLFVGDLNGHHQEWFGSTTTNRHGVAAFDFATVSGCDQLVVDPTHARGGTLDLLMTNVPDLVRVAVVAPLGNSDHSPLPAVISMAQAVPNLCVSWKVFLKHQVNWNTVCGAIRELPWHNICLSDNPVEVLNEQLSLLVGRYVPTKVIRVRNNDKPWFDDQRRHAFASSRRLIFGVPVIALGLAGKSLSAFKRELMKPTQTLSGSLVTETGMFLWTSSPLISGSPL